jgi:hypothetical protein
MKHSGRRPRGPIGRITGVHRVEGLDTSMRIHALERVSGTEAIEARPPPERSFSAVLERYERGLSRSEPVPLPVQRRPFPLAVRDDEEPLQGPEPLPDTFLGLLWWKVKGRLQEP